MFHLCNSCAIFIFTAFWTLLHQTLTQSTAIFWFMLVFSCFYLSRFSLLCFWPVYWLFRLYVHDASNQIHVSTRVLSPVCAFCCMLWFLDCKPPFLLWRCRTVVDQHWTGLSCLSFVFRILVFTTTELNRYNCKVALGNTTIITNITQCRDKTCCSAGIENKTNRICSFAKRELKTELSPTLFLRRTICGFIFVLHTKH